MYAPLDPKLQKMHDKEKRLLEDLERKYPKAATDDFQKSCITWELLYGGKSVWIIDCPQRDVQKTMDTFNEMLGIFSGFEAGITTSAVTDKPDGSPMGFQILCRENAKDSVKAKLTLMGIPDSEMHWIPELELRRQFEDWKKQQQLNQRFKERLAKKTGHRQMKPNVPNSDQNGRFKLIVDQTKAHKDFIALRDLAHYAGARQLMNELYSSMGDTDGNFLSNFQSHGFHSRLFELACYGYLKAQGFSVNRNFPSPDFLVSLGKEKVAIEAVTVNPSSGLARDISLDVSYPKLSFGDLYNKSTNEFPIRMGTALLKKLKKRYWLLPHCQKIPFVLITSPFYEPGSIFHIDDSLARYLYGGWDVFPDWVNHKGLFTRVVPIKSHKYERKELRANFFSQPMSENVSAVIYSNSYTTCKFVRMAIQMGLESKFIAIKSGTCLLPSENGDILTQEFEYRVGDQTAPIENWFQGLTIFHNPKAIIPLPENIFRSTNVYQVQNGKLIRDVNSFHPLVSFTVISPVGDK